MLESHQLQESAEGRVQGGRHGCAGAESDGKGGRRRRNTGRARSRGAGVELQTKQSPGLGSSLAEHGTVTGYLSPQLYLRLI